MPLIRTPEKNLFFAHCPKAGGTSIEVYLEDRFGTLELYDRSWERFWRQCGWKNPPYRSAPQHLNWDEAMPHLPDDVTVFTVVRDPLERLISEYRFQARKAPRRYPLRPLLTRLGFSTWLRIMHHAARRDPYVMDNHIRPQVDFFPEGTKVFRLEDGLEHMCAWLDDIHPASRTNTGVGHEQKSRAWVTRPEPRAEDLALVAKLYSADYARLDYAKPAASGSKDRLAGLRDMIGRTLAPFVVWAFNRGQM